MLRDVPEDNTGLSKLPEAVRIIMNDYSNSVFNAIYNIINNYLSVHLSHDYLPKPNPNKNLKPRLKFLSSP